MDFRLKKISRIIASKIKTLHIKSMSRCIASSFHLQFTEKSQFGGDGRQENQAGCFDSLS